MEQTPYINFDREFSPNSDDGWSSADYMVYRTNMYSMDIVTPHNINYLIKRLQEIAVVEQNNLANCSKQSSSELEPMKPQSLNEERRQEERKKGEKEQDVNLPNHNDLRPFNSMTNLTKSIETDSSE